MLGRLALRNVKRQVGNYLIYFMTVAFTVAMLFAVSNIICSDQLLRLTAVNEELYGMLAGIVILISAVVAFVLSYAMSFMLRLRKREFGTYLTLGMTRRDILAVFLSETAIIGVFSLAAGLLIGLFAYQGLSMLMMKLLEVRIELAAYSSMGLLMTVVLVVGIFFLASLVSAFYLKRTSIQTLLHGEKRTREIRHPLGWFLVMILSFAVCTGGIFLISREISADSESLEQIGNMVFLCAVSLILFHVGLARSLIHFLLRRKGLCSRGSAVFVLRSLSGMLGVNSVMLGFLAFLLTFAVLGINAAFIQRISQEESLKKKYPYDVVYAAGQNEETIKTSEAEALIRKYTDIKSKFSYCAYTTGRGDFYGCTQWAGYIGLTDSFVKLSDFNALIVPLGYEPVSLSDEYMIVPSTSKAEKGRWEGFVFEQNGRRYRLNSVCSDYPSFSYVYFFIVVPDEAVEGMEVQTEYIVYDTEDNPYDAVSLKEELTYESSGWKRCDYSLREYGRQEENSTNAFLVTGALFVAVVFLFMAMAILALKILSGLDEDKRRYGILNRIGTGYQEQSRTLFAQTFGFFMLPFVVPLLMNIPVAVIGRQIAQEAAMVALKPQITTIAVATAAVMAAVYLLYYTAAYQIARRAVVRQEI